MKVVWRLKRATVRDVHDALREHREVAYTTVMTMMRILETKGYLEKTLHERAYVYQPSLDRVFDGAPQGLLLHLAKDGRLTTEQKRVVKALLEETDK